MSVIVTIRPLGVAVQAANPKICTEVGEEDRGIADEEDDRPPPSAPRALIERVEVGSIDEPCHERGRFLRVPAPVPAPRRVGPVGPQRNAERQQWKAYDDGRG